MKNIKKIFTLLLILVITFVFSSFSYENNYENLIPAPELLESYEAPDYYINGVKLIPLKTEAFYTTEEVYEAKRAEAIANGWKVVDNITADE